MTKEEALKKEDKNAVFLRNLQWILAAVSLLLLVGIALSLPLILNSLNFSMAKYGLITRLIIQLTLGSWVSSVFMMTIPFIFVYYVQHDNPDVIEYDKRKAEIVKIRNYTAWACAVLTAAGVYAIQWFGGSL